MKRILVTGGSGLLGSELVKSFQSIGYFVLRPTRSQLDLTNFQSTKEYFAKHEIDSVIHCAAVVGGIQANLENPMNFIVTNLKMDMNVIEASLASNIKEFVFFGSSCMYPRDAQQPMAETQIMLGPLEPTNQAYAMAKLATSEMIRTIGNSPGMAYRTLVLSNIYGLGQSEDPINSHLIGAINFKFREALRTENREISIWGSGNVRREFTHVKDVASWVAKNLQNLSNFPQMLNIGLGTDYSIKEFYEIFAKAYGGGFTFSFDLEKPEGMPLKLLDSGVARRRFAWNPVISPYDGIQELVAENRGG